MAFDDSLLEDREALGAADGRLRYLATTGARIRSVAADLIGPTGAEALVRGFDAGRRPRGVVVVGAESRLIRAVLEPVCPMPLIAWPFAGLPGWVGPLDLVVVLASSGSQPDLMATAAEAVRRGSALVVAATPDSPIAEQAAGRMSLVLPVHERDGLATAVLMLAVLHELGLGPMVRPAGVAEVVDTVAEESAPAKDLAVNPAKDLALNLADHTPLVWGGSVLAARASRRVAEAIRRASGRAAVSADADALRPVLEHAQRPDMFADPDEGAARPVLVVLDDGSSDESVRRDRGELLSLAQRQEVRVATIATGLDTSGPIDAYAALLQRGLFGAAYLAIGLAMPPAEPEA